MTPTVSVTTTTRSSIDPFVVAHGDENALTRGFERKPSQRARSTSAIPQTHRRSPSDSGLSSDCEIDPKTVPTTRGRHLGKDLEHKLHEAVSSITVTRSLSPEEGRRSSINSDLDPPHIRIITASESSSTSEVPPRIGHAKSAALYSLGTLDLSAQLSRDGSCAIESDMDDHVKARPHRMVRKKSGELVRSSLKSGSRRPASMPSTPVFTKNVKFDRKLEHIRHFLHSEKPAAVSANTSPTQEYATNSDFPMRFSPRKTDPDDFELSIDLPNFVPEAQQADNEGAIIKVETVYLSSDKSSLIGRVAVRNLAFQKHVSVRYTLDHWRTTSDTAAEYTDDVRKKQRDDPFDRFLFRIKIDDFTGVTDKTMFFCVRYHTAGQDFWDSNGGQNFRVEFHKRAFAERRHSDPPLMAPIRRPSSDEIEVKGDDIELFDQASNRPLRSPRSLIFENIYDDHPGNNPEDLDHDKPVKTRSGSRRRAPTDSFSNRYDFGASLTAAIAAANSMLQGSGEEIKTKTKAQVEHVENVTQYNPYFAVKPRNTFVSEKYVMGTVSPNFPPGLDSSEGNSPVSSGNASPIPGVPAKSDGAVDKGQAYQKLLDNYCFVWK